MKFCMDKCKVENSKNNLGFIKEMEKNYNYQKAPYFMTDSIMKTLHEDCPTTVKKPITVRHFKKRNRKNTYGTTHICNLHTF